MRGRKLFVMTQFLINTFSVCRMGVKAQQGQSLPAGISSPRNTARSARRRCTCSVAALPPGPATVVQSLPQSLKLLQHPLSPNRETVFYLVVPRFEVLQEQPITTGMEEPHQGLMENTREKIMGFLPYRGFCKGSLQSCPSCYQKCHTTSHQN